MAAGAIFGQCRVMSQPYELRVEPRCVGAARAWLSLILVARSIETYHYHRPPEETSESTRLRLTTQLQNTSRLLESYGVRPNFVICYQRRGVLGHLDGVSSSPLPKTLLKSTVVQPISDKAEGHTWGKNQEMSRFQLM